MAGRCQKSPCLILTSQGPPGQLSDDVSVTVGEGRIGPLGTSRDGSSPKTLQRIDQRAASLLPGCSTLVRVTTAVVLLDSATMRWTASLAIDEGLKS
jgi:hypothetical protein